MMMEAMGKFDLEMFFVSESKENSKLLTTQ